ncbi:Arf GTPase activating protein [Gracilaria domingensis]|nr:Arf GTPase activating protein [Gracilaria domingensis]
MRSTRPQIARSLFLPSALFATPTPLLATGPNVCAARSSWGNRPRRHLRPPFFRSSAAAIALERFEEMSSRYVSRAAQDAEHALRDVQGRLEGNQYCADCGVPNPDFINLTIGTFICDVCADFHRTSSNRKVKDIFGGDLTLEDIRRMDSVGNDTANRKFLAVWDSREFPEPDRRDRDALREFLWLKYEGIFKKTQPANPPPPPPEPSRSYYDNKSYDAPLERSRRERPMRREHELFRDGPAPPGRAKGYWSARFGDPRPPQPPPQHMAMPPSEQMRRPREDYYGRPMSAAPYPDRYRTNAPQDRFQPPQPTPVVPYGFPRSSRSRYREEAYEDYASNASSRDRERRHSERSSTKPSSPDSYSDLEEERTSKKKKSSKNRSKGRRKKSDLVDSDEQENEEYDDDEQDERYRKKASRKSKKKSSKDGKSKRKDEEYEENGVYDDEEYSSSEEEASPKSKKKTSKRETDPGKGGKGGPAEASEFDLMSEWMGDGKKEETPRPANPAAIGGNPGQGIPQAMQQAYQTAQIPMMPPMSMYGSVMPMPGGGFMPMMPPPGMMPPHMGMPGMPPMPPMPPGMMGGMPPMRNAPGMPQGGGVSGVPGLINGMHNLNMTSRPQPVGPSPVQPPPPPPPMGMPAGPPPGPPPDPPRKS